MYLAVVPPAEAFPQCEVGDFVARANQVVDGIEHVKVHDAKRRTGLCEEHVVYRLQPKAWVSGRTEKTTWGCFAQTEVEGALDVAAGFTPNCTASMGGEC